MRYINTCTTIQLAHAEMKLATHIQNMNNDGWEILSVSINNIGIHELFVIFWKKPRPEEKVETKSYGVTSSD